MKKNFFLLVIVLGVFLFSCKKEKITDQAPLESGIQWKGFRGVSPASSFAEIPTGIFYWDTISMRQILYEKLPHDGSKKDLYLVQVPGDMNLVLAEEDLKRRGWHIAPLAYGVGMLKQYTIPSLGDYTVCLEIPKKIDFGNGNGPETAAMFIQQSYSETYIELVPKKTTVYGSWIRYLVYR